MLIRCRKPPKSPVCRPRRSGLTIIELVVVLAVLVALSALIIPMFPNILRRAHKAGDASQSTELAKAIMTHQAMFVSYPDNFDLLTDGTALPSYLPNDGGATFGGFVTAGTLTAGERAALNRVGVTYVQKMATDNTATGFHPTMYPYASAYNGSSKVDITSSAGTSLNFAILNLTTAQTANPAFLQTITANDPTAKFVVLGVGPRCSMVGQTIHEAPTSVPQNKQLTPDTTYSRFGAIFMVAGAEVSRTERARFIATVALEDDELELAEKDIVGYYGVARDPRQ